MSEAAVGRHRVDNRPLRVAVVLLLCALTAAAGCVVIPSSPSESPVITPDPTPMATQIPAIAPGGKLPTSQECAARVTRRGVEQRPENARANATTGSAGVVPAWPENGYSPELNARIVPRIDGAYTGTTDEILEWGACKWGFEPDVVRAMAVEESGWLQSTAGDVSDEQSDCVEGAFAPCPTSFGIMQVKHLFRPGSYPLSAQSTAFNVDYALGAVRACYEGWVIYLDNGYAAGDVWGCLGWHFSGGWRDPLALGYVSRVRQEQAEQAWTRW